MTQAPWFEWNIPDTIPGLKDWPTWTKPTRPSADVDAIARAWNALLAAASQCPALDPTWRTYLAGASGEVTSWLQSGPFDAAHIRTIAATVNTIAVSVGRFCNVTIPLILLSDGTTPQLDDAINRQTPGAPSAPDPSFLGRPPADPSAPTLQPAATSSGPGAGALVAAAACVGLVLVAMGGRR
jgi:hypothetical protein